MKKLKIMLPILLILLLMTAPAMADEAETLTAREYWPYPTYGDLLFGVK